MPDLLPLRRAILAGTVALLATRLRGAHAQRALPHQAQAPRLGLHQDRRQPWAVLLAARTNARLEAERDARELEAQGPLVSHVHQLDGLSALEGILGPLIHRGAQRERGVEVIREQRLLRALPPRVVRPRELAPGHPRGIDGTEPRRAHGRGVSAGILDGVGRLSGEVDAARREAAPDGIPLVDAVLRRVGA